MNKAAICAGLCVDMFLTHLVKYLGGQLLDLMIRLFSVVVASLPK